MRQPSLTFKFCETPDLLFCVAAALSTIILHNTLKKILVFLSGCLFRFAGILQFYTCAYPNLIDLLWIIFITQNILRCELICGWLQVYRDDLKLLDCQLCSRGCGFLPPAEHCSLCLSQRSLLRLLG